MATLNGIPVFTISIESDLEDVTGVEYISMVAEPAIMTNWVAMSKSMKSRFSVDAEKQMLYGPFLIPDMPIYRSDETMGEYYVVFTKEMISKISQKFMKQQKTVNVNYEHMDDSKVQSASIVETWLTGNNDKSKDFGFDMVPGSWFGGVHIEDPEFWKQEVKSGNVKGFSIEGFLNMDMKKINKKNDMTKKLKFEAQVKAKDGTVYYTPDDSFAEQVDIYTVDATGAQNPAPDGDILLEDGSTLTVKSGKVTAIAAATAQAASPVEFSLTDGTSLFLGITDSEGSITLLVPAFSDAAGTTPAPDGEYAPTKDGVIITVLKGTVQCIETTDSEAADDAGSIPDVSAEMSKVLQKMSAMQIAFDIAMKTLNDKILASENTINTINSKFSSIPGTTTATTKVDDVKKVSNEPKKIDYSKRIAELKAIQSKK